MAIAPFKIEEFFAQHEFSTPYLFGASDAETISMAKLLEYSDPETLQLWNHLKLCYTETRGLPELRQEIALLHSTVNADNVLICSGAEEGIYAATQVLAKPGDHAVIVTPCYQSHKTLPAYYGAEITEVAIKPQGSQWQLNFEDLENAMRENTQFISINFPNNPTSYLPDQEMFAKIVQLARNAGAYLLSDEIYRYSEQNEKDRLPAACDVYEKGISLSGTSKLWGLPGLRIGWLVCHDTHLLNRICSVKNYLSLCNSAPSEILTIMALRAREKILNRNREIVIQNLKLLDDFFSKHPDLFEWRRPNAGITAFTRLKHAMPIDALVEKLIHAQGVVLLAGSVYDYPGNFFRIGFGRANMPEALSRFSQFIKNNINVDTVFP
jgi:aspartate/methionine/tyrosine aminotransferase